MTHLPKKLSGWFGPGAPEGPGRDELRAGATYSRLTETQVTETAHVLGITEDEGGIAHVRYRCRLHRAGRTLDEGERTLALPSFLGRFKQAAAPEAPRRARVPLRAAGASAAGLRP